MYCSRFDMNPQQKRMMERLRKQKTEGKGLEETPITEPLQIVSIEKPNKNPNVPEPPKNLPTNKEELEKLKGIVLKKKKVMKKANLKLIL